MLSALLIVFATTGSLEPPQSETTLADGLWRAWLDSPGGALPFRMEFERDGADWKAHVVNASERISYDTIELRANRLVVQLDPYEAVIEARIGEDGRRLEGEWRRATGADATGAIGWARLPFHAVAGDSARFSAVPTEAAAEVNTTQVLAGRWAVQFESDEHLAVGLFEAGAGNLTVGTFLTTLGDYRFLEGDFDGQRLRLSCFDGAHAFLFHAELDSSGRLHGDFWSRDSWHESFEAWPDKNAELPDPFELTRWKEEVALGDLAFPDLSGRMRRLDDPEFSGRARLIVLFGSWCPNCHDETRYLVELERRFADRGLAIQGLAFELDPAPQASRERLLRYARLLEVSYPLLVAGPADKDRATQAMPALDRVRAYPTTLFLDRENRVRWIHTGFSGPATGAAHAKLREAFESRIDELINEE